jgi:Asp-tRNA(Asn)/Glu-tRNA(Gln) amidotransferase A subunit family amidase
VPTRSGEPTARELVSHLAGGDVSSRELAERYLARVESAAEVLNAVAHVDPESTLAAADRADRALAAGERGALLGLPVSIKDSIAVADMPCRSGSWAREENVPMGDATVVARVRAAGALVLCKSAVAEYTWSTETDSAIFGRTNNPYDSARTCGGSSGGEAALHAVGASPAGIGSDGLCSLRVPAHFCGTFGLRPTVRLVPETGAWPTTKNTGMLDMSTLGPMGRSVDDLAMLLPIIAGPDDVDPLVDAAKNGD